MTHNDIEYQKHFVNVTDSENVCLHRFVNLNSSTKGVVLMSHGAMEDGRIFYSLKKWKGLAPFLAKQGYDVFVMDGRGKGESAPSIERGMNYSQMEHICNDMHTVIKYVSNESKVDKFHFVGHSWGGVLQLAYYARFHKEINLKSMVFFGSKRRISIKSWKKFLHVDLVWNFVGYFLGGIYGYAPFKKLKIGSENEPNIFFREMNKWVYSKNWIDIDGFNYKKHLEEMDMPPALYMTGIKDDILGNPIDVKLLMSETGNQKGSKFLLLSKSNGNLNDYGHIDILTHKDAVEDQFLEALLWMNAFN